MAVTEESGREDEDDWLGVETEGTGLHLDVGGASGVEDELELMEGGGGRPGVDLIGGGRSGRSLTPEGRGGRGGSEEFTVWRVSGLVWVREPFLRAGDGAVVWGLVLGVGP